MRSKRYTCRGCCLVLHCIALHLSLALCSQHCFSVVLFLQASSALLDPYLQCVHSAALVPIAKVRPKVSSLPSVCAAWRYFAVWLVEHLVAGLFGRAFLIPPLPLYILVVGVCYSLACLQSYWLTLVASCFSILLFQWFSLILLLLLLLF